MGKNYRSVEEGVRVHNDEYYSKKINNKRERISNSIVLYIINVK